MPASQTPRGPEPREVYLVNEQDPSRFYFSVDDIVGNCLPSQRSLYGRPTLAEARATYPKHHMTSVLQNIERDLELRGVLYPLSFRSPEHRHLAVQRASARTLSKEVLQALRDQNPLITALNDADSHPLAFVVTGQQLGYLGGPLLTLYKALSAISTSRVFEAETGVKVIPLFWLQSEDHDYEEIRTASFLSQDNQIETLSLPPSPTGLGGSVGAIQIDDTSATQAAAFLKAKFGDSASEKSIDAIIQAYSAGNSLSTSLAELLRHFLGGEGLLVLDAHDPRIKQFSVEFLLRFFRDSEEIEHALLKRAQLLESHQLPVKVPVRVGYPLPFVEFGGKRERIRKINESTFQSSQGEISADQLYAALRHSPMRLTTSALARPLFQDFLLPTAAYIGGAAEVAYWAQLSGVYELLGVDMPLVIPRAQFALCTERQQTMMKELKLSISDLARSDEDLVLSRATSSEHPDALFKRTEDAIETEMARLAKDISGIQVPAVSEGIERTTGSMLSNLSKLKTRYARAITERDSIFLARVNKLRASLLPGGQDQERVICATQLLAQENDGLLKEIICQLTPFEPSDIQLLRISKVA